MAKVIYSWLGTTDFIADAPDVWTVSHDVYPNTPGVSTDVMLVQAFLVAYFLSPAGVRPDLKAQATAILVRFGKRFDDGIYGESTRALMSLFEEDIRAPFRDGIVRTLSQGDVLANRQTKLAKMNFAWNMTMLSDTLGTTKKESGRTALRPVLFRELYPS